MFRPSLAVRTAPRIAVVELVSPTRQGAPAAVMLHPREAISMHTVRVQIAALSFMPDFLLCAALRRVYCAPLHNYSYGEEKSAGGCVI